MVLAEDSEHACLLDLGGPQGLVRSLSEKSLVLSMSYHSFVYPAIRCLEYNDCSQASRAHA